MLYRIYLTVVVSSSECSIRDNEGADYAELQLAESQPSSGYLSYLMSCSGTVTSIRARGFCPVGTNGSSNVVMQIFNSTYIQGKFKHTDTNVTAECNTSAAVGSDYYEGYVSKDDLNINVESGGFLSVRLNSNCSCFFLPAILVNKTSKHNLLYLDDGLESSDPGGSLFFTAIITGYDNTTLVGVDLLCIMYYRCVVTNHPCIHSPLLTFYRQSARYG